MDRESLAPKPKSALKSLGGSFAFCGLVFAGVGAMNLPENPVAGALIALGILVVLAGLIALLILLFKVGVVLIWGSAPVVKETLNDLNVAYKAATTKRPLDD